MNDKEKKIEQIRLQLKKKVEYGKQHRVERITSMLNNLKPFKCVDDIPDIPIVPKDIYKDIIIPNIIRCGGIPKAQLKPHTRYLGNCRNATEAEWTGERFLYCRHKFGTEFIDDVDHFEDGAETEADVFVPIKEI